MRDSVSSHLRETEMVGQRKKERGEKCVCVCERGREREGEREIRFDRSNTEGNLVVLLVKLCEGSCSLSLHRASVTIRGSCRNLFCAFLREWRMAIGAYRITWGRSRPLPPARIDRVLYHDFQSARYVFHAYCHTLQEPS